MPTTYARHPAAGHSPTTARDPAAGDTAIQVRGLRNAFGSVKMLDGVDLDVATGGVHALLGPNGAGRTTLVRILATLLPADGGLATVAGRDARREPRPVPEVISLTGQHSASAGIPRRRARPEVAPALRPRVLTELRAAVDEVISPALAAAMAAAQEGPSRRPPAAY